MNYWDTSALLKLYVAERDSPYFVRLLATTGERVFTSVIGATEMLCALHQREQRGDLYPGGAQELFREFSADVNSGKIVTIPYAEDIVAEAEKLVQLVFGYHPPVMLRALDAIHVASALAGKAKVVVSTDARLRQVAALAKLKVLP